MTANLQLKGVGKLGPRTTVTVLASASLNDENSLDEPRKVAPVASTLNPVGAESKYAFEPSR